MRLLRLRFTVRHMMLTVAVVGVVLAVLIYRQQLRGMAAYHESKAFRLFKPITVKGAGPVGTIRLPGAAQAGTLAFQPTPEGMEQRRIADHYSSRALKLEKTFAAVLLVSIAWGMVEVLAARRRDRG